MGQLQPDRGCRGQHDLARQERAAWRRRRGCCSRRRSAKPIPPSSTPPSAPERISPASHAARDGGAGRGQGTLGPDRNQPLDEPAVLGARRELLADEAALAEADPVQLLEPALQQDRLLHDEVAAAVGHAELEPVPVVVGERGGRRAATNASTWSRAAARPAPRAPPAAGRRPGRRRPRLAQRPPPAAGRARR